MDKQITKEFAKVLKMIAKNPQQFSGVSSVELNGEEVWADKLTAEDIQEIEKELGGNYKVQSRLANGTDTMELYLTIPKKETTEDFIEEARKVHGDKYDYSKVNLS